MRRLSSLPKDVRGAAAVEAALVAPIVFTLVFATVDLGLYLWRWNQQVDAVRIGARIAAVSDPVSSDLAAMTGLATGAAPGQPAGTYARVCSLSGANGACEGGTYDPAAMTRILYGPSGQSCTDSNAQNAPGMCDILQTVQPSHVTVSYRASGVDSAGVEGALRPLVSVKASQVPSGTVLIHQLFPGAFAKLPTTETTVVAEDLRSS